MKEANGEGGGTECSKKKESSRKRPGETSTSHGKKVKKGKSERREGSWGE